MKCRNCIYSPAVTSMGYCRICAMPAMKVRVQHDTDAYWTLLTLAELTRDLEGVRRMQDFADNRHKYNSVIEFFRFSQIGANG